MLYKNRILIDAYVLKSDYEQTKRKNWNRQIMLYPHMQNNPLYRNIICLFNESEYEQMLHDFYMHNEYKSYNTYFCDGTYLMDLIRSAKLVAPTYIRTINKLRDNINNGNSIKDYEIDWIIRNYNQRFDNL